MVRRTRVKICGITRLEDAQCAERLGVDALGFVFVPASSRNITLETAAEISRYLPSLTTRVGLFLNAAVSDVAAAMQRLPDLIPQFHGQETPEFCEQFGCRYLKAIGMAGGMPAAETLQAYRGAGGFLFDSNAPGQLGGTGHTFDWQQLSSVSDVPLILAGGLNVENVASAINTVRPYAVDVSTGVEISKGIKDSAKMQAFMNSVMQTDHTISLASQTE